jgi:hypothetical protein
MRKRKEKSIFGRRMVFDNKTPIPTCRIEIGSDFINLLSAATQTKPEKTISDLYFFFLGEYKKVKPNSILFKRNLTEENNKENHSNFTFLYKIFGFNVKITATVYVSSRERYIQQNHSVNNNLVVMFTQGDNSGRIRNYRKVFDIKYLEDKMFSEQLFG